MKRMNFTFLLLFALLSVFSTKSWAQDPSNSCVDVVNISLDEDCSLSVSVNTFGAQGSDEVDSLFIVGDALPAGSGIGMTVGSGMLTSEGVQTFPGIIPVGTYEYRLYSGSGFHCWGTLNVENKNTLEPGGGRDTICCIDNRPDAPTIESIMDSISSACVPGIEGDLSMRVREEGDGECDTILRITDFTGTIVTAHGEKRQGVVWSDTLLITPLDTTMIKMPHNWVDIDCDPEFDFEPEQIAHIKHEQAVEALKDTTREDCHAVIDSVIEANEMNLGIPYAYPYLCKDSVTIVCEVIDTIMIDTTLDTIDVKQYINGDSVWTRVVVVDKDPDTTFVEDTIVLPIYTAIDKGQTCNISAKCVDMDFPSCVDEEKGRVMRTWSVIDFCNKSQWDSVQWIKLQDTLAPYFHGEYVDGSTSYGELDTLPDTLHATIYAYEKPWTCDWSHKVLDLWAEDICSDVYYEYHADEGRVNDEGYLVDVWPETDSVWITIIATDGCKNADTIVYKVKPLDKVNPVAIADDEINISLTADHESEVYDSLSAVTKIWTKDIDEGSHDSGCGPVTACLIRPEDEEGPQVLDCQGRLLGTAPVTCGACTVTVPQGEKQKINGEYRCVYYDEDGNMINPVEVVTCCDYVKFCCSDIGSNYVKMYVYDAALHELDEPDTIFNTEEEIVEIRKYQTDIYGRTGNKSVSWTNVNVENKAGYAVECPQDREITCDSEEGIHAGSVPFDAPKVWGICGPVDVYHIDEGVIDNCGEGEIIRHWYAATDSQLICRQIISGSAESGFDPYSIKWPKHYDDTEYTGIRRECEEINEDGDYGIKEYQDDISMGASFECSGDVMTAPIWCNSSCSLILSSYEDQEVAADDVCKKIIRRHTVIDWCTWEPNGNDVPDDANDTGYDQFEAVDDEWLDHPVAANVKEYYPCEDCDKPTGEADHVFFRYTQVDEDGYYTFDQIIKITDKEAPIVVAPDTAFVNTVGGAIAKGDTTPCYGEGMVYASVSDSCGGMALDAQSASWWIERKLYDLDGEQVGDVVTRSITGDTVSMSTGVGQAGYMAEIIWIARDGCGNSAQKTTKVIFADDKNPTPICIQDLSTATMNVEGSSVAIWAEDFDLGSFDNCGLMGTFFKDTAGNYTTSVDFSCDDIANGVSQTFELQLWAVDHSGNEDFCYVTLRVDDNADICGPGPDSTASILGEVRTELGDMVESARVNLGTINADETAVDGKYAFPGNEMYQNYEVSANKNDDHDNGVTALDLVLIQRHILGLDLLDSPYKVIAADVNGDARVNVSDLTELRRLLLGAFDALPNNNSWRFVDASQSFDNNLSPFPFAELIDVDLQTKEAGLGNDFIGVKIGDVNSNAIANSAIAASRTTGNLELTVADAQLSAGQTTKVAVSASNFDNITAYQLTMDLGSLELVGVESGAIAITSEDYIASGDAMSMVWTSTDAVSADDALFYLVVRAPEATSIAQNLNVNSSITTAEAYTSSLESLDVSMAFTKGSDIVATDDFALLQNTPNPFELTTTVGFKLPAAGTATLTVFDMTGTTVHVVKGDYNKGYNEITLRKADLNAAGVMYYQLESGSFTATKKMIIIE